MARTQISSYQAKLNLSNMLDVQVDPSAGDSLIWNSELNSWVSQDTVANTNKIANIPVYSSDTDPTGTTRVNVDGYLYATKVFNAVLNDYAECFESDYHIEDIKYRIVEIKNKKVYLAEEKSEAVVGVVSTSYGFLLYGSEEEIEKGIKVPVGMAGTLLIDSEDKVNYNNINRFVYSGKEGKARVIPKGEAYKYEGCIVGKIIDVDEKENQYKIIICLR